MRLGLHSAVALSPCKKMRLLSVVQINIALRSLALSSSLLSINIPYNLDLEVRFFGWLITGSLTFDVMCLTALNRSSFVNLAGISER